MFEQTARQAIRMAQDEKEYVSDLLTRLIRTPSPSCEEGDAVELVRREMESIGLDEVFVDSIGSVVGRVGRGSRKIVYDSHLDTVGVGDPASWKVDPFGGEVRDGIIFGRGASDNKAGVACMVAALRILKKLAEQADFTLYVVGIVQEENCEGLALSVLLEEKGLNPDCVVLGECTNLGINRGHRGRAEIEVITRGRSCHASAPERGDNAVYRMAPVVEGIKWMGAKLRSDPFLGKGTIAVTGIECSTPSRNALPDVCRIYVDRRTVPGDTRESVAREIDEIVRFVEGEVRITTYSRPSHRGLLRHREKFFPAWVVEESDPAVKSAVDTFSLLFGTMPEVGKWDFSTDGNYSMGIRSIPTIGFGPGEERHAHSTDDQVRVDDLWKASAFYALFPFVYSS
jgi:putative selenium metabolism hydrolase